MTIQLPYRITVTRDRPVEGAPRRGRPIARGAATLAGLAALTLAPGVAGASTALAATSNGPVSATINVVPAAVKSVTVSISNFTYGGCSGGSSTGNTLGFPNGFCQSAQYTVTNGPSNAQIDVQGADAVPATGATNWTLCGFPGNGCLGPNAFPGPDQYTELVGNNLGSVTLTNTPACDVNFSTSATCITAAANAQSVESPAIRGPQSSTNTSSSFTTTITYTAV